MECPICFEIIINSCTGSCSHHFCYKCLTDWKFKGGQTCPMCNEKIIKIRPDPEFDYINNLNDDDDRANNSYNVNKYFRMCFRKYILKQ